MTKTSQTTFHLSVLAAGALLASAAQAQDVQTVKIAHAGPTSGGIAHIGKDTENGVRLAIDELNAQNLTIGGKKIKFEIAADGQVLRVQLVNGQAHAVFGVLADVGDAARGRAGVGDLDGLHVLRLSGGGQQCAGGQHREVEGGL